MSWDITIRSTKGSLGSLEAVREVIARILPSTKFGRVPSGVEKIRLAGAQGIQFPSFIRESMLSQPAMQEAEFEADGLSFSFRFGSEDSVREISLEVRGSRDPLPLLRLFAGVDDWQVMDDSTGKLLTVNTQAASTGWQTYQRMLAKVRNRPC